MIEARIASRSRARSTVTLTARVLSGSCIGPPVRCVSGAAAGVAAAALVRSGVDHGARRGVAFDRVPSIRLVLVRAERERRHRPAAFNLCAASVRRDDDRLPAPVVYLAPSGKTTPDKRLGDL